MHLPIKKKKNTQAINLAKLKSLGFAKSHYFYINKKYYWGHYELSIIVHGTLHVDNVYVKYKQDLYIYQSFISQKKKTKKKNNFSSYL